MWSAVQCVAGRCAVCRRERSARASDHEGDDGGTGTSGNSGAENSGAAHESSDTHTHPFDDHCSANTTSTPDMSRAAASSAASSSSSALPSYSATRDYAASLASRADDSLPSGSGPRFVRQASFADDDLHYACRVGDLARMRKYLDAKPNLIMSKDGYGQRNEREQGERSRTRGM